MPNLTVKSNGEQIPVETFDLKLGINKLGRTSDNHLQIPSQTVSTSHCEIVWMDDAVLVRDLNSTNGTFINGIRITESRLEAGQVLRVGDVELCLDTDRASISVPRFSEGATVAVTAPHPERCRARSIPARQPITTAPIVKRIFANRAFARLGSIMGGTFISFAPFAAPIVSRLFTSKSANAALCSKPCKARSACQARIRRKKCKGGWNYQRDRQN